MNIIFDGIIYSLQRSGGITRYANELISGLSKHNNVEVLTHRTRVQDPPIPGIDCTPTLPMQKKGLKYMSLPFDTFFTERFLKKQQYTQGVFHSTYYTHYKNVKLPQVVTVHDMIHERFGYFNTWTGRLYMKRKKYVVQRADHIICISEQTSKDVQEKYNVNRQNISVIHHGVSKIFFEESKEIHSFKKKYNITKPFLLFVGTRGTYKNFEAFITAYAAWNNPHVDVVVVGGLFSRAEETLLKVLNIKKRVHELGYIPDAELRDVYTAATALVFPSEYEGFGLPLLESYACGTPVIANDIPVFREIAADTPYYINPKEKNSFISAFNAVLKENDENATMYRQTLAKSFTWEKTIQKTEEVYKNIMNDAHDSI